MLSFVALSFCILPLTFVHDVQGHGRLIDPPARSTMWRYGYQTPVNTDDMALYCGGFNRQWGMNGGRCGVCGDPWDGPRDHEAGGKYAKGILVKHYSQGEMINVAVELTTSHLGWFEFRICPNNNPARRVTQQCLDSNLLRLADGSTRYQVRSWDRKVHQVTLQLPAGLTCTQCVLQWKYNAGNSWGCTGHNTGCCKGCGHQEQFYGCADVSISGNTNVGGTGLYNPGSNQVDNNKGNGGFIPISIGNPPSVAQPGNTNTNPNTGGYIVIDNSHPGSPINSGSTRISRYTLLMKCKGLLDVYTQLCRRSCSTGYCSPSICSKECMALVR